MATRSVLAVPTDNGFKGRYAHSDGNPTWMLVQMFRIVAEHGVDTARRILTEDYYGWSRITPATDDLGDGLGTFDDGTPRVHVVAGVGLAFSKREQPDEWYLSTDAPADMAYAYVLNDTGVAVFGNVHDEAGKNKWEHVGNVRYTDDLTDETLVRLECGEDYERCSHYAWVHDARVPRESRMGMGQWIGRDPMRTNDIATGHFPVSPIHYRRADYTLTGSSSTGTADSSDWRAASFNPDRPRYLWVSVRDADGANKGYKRLGRMLKSGDVKLDVDVTMPATRDGEPTRVLAGSTLPY